MKKLAPKISDFSGTSLFVRADGTHEILASETLPEGFVLGVELSESGYVNTSLGTFVLKVNIPPLLLVDPGPVEFSDSNFYAQIEFDTDIEELDLGLVTVVPQNGTGGVTVAILEEFPNSLDIFDDDGSILSGEVTVTIPTNALQGVGGETLAEALVIVYDFTSGS